MSAFKQTAGSESTWGLTLYGYSVATNIYTNMDPYLHLWDNKPPGKVRQEIIARIIPFISMIAILTINIILNPILRSLYGI